MLTEEKNKVDDNDDNLLISKWFPITEVSIESVRERGAFSALPPLYYLHVWFARRPLATSRAAIIGSILPNKANRSIFFELLGIPENVDIEKAQERITRAKLTGVRIKDNPFFWPRAYTHSPSSKELTTFHDILKDFWGVKQPLIVDPMAGGGSIPFEAIRLGLPVVAGDLNPVAFICLKGTLEYPIKFGKKLLPEVEKFCKEIHETAKAEIKTFFPKKLGEKNAAYLWTRTLKCSSCGLTIPLSPNWWIIRSKNNNEDVAAKILVPTNEDKCNFEIIKNPVFHKYDPNKGTVKGGRAECPRCHTVIDGHELKQEAQKGGLGHQLYCVCLKEQALGNKKEKWNFREVSEKDQKGCFEANEELIKRKPKWEKFGWIPNETYHKGFSDRCSVYGVSKWSDLFNNRQLLTHLIYLEKFQQIKENLFLGKKPGSEEWNFCTAIATYGAIVFDTCISYNCLISRWDPTRRKICNALELQAFPFKWSYGEWNNTTEKMGYEWALAKVLKSLRRIIKLLPKDAEKPTVYCGSATKITSSDESVPCIVVDPPYSENVMYSEISDFFYVWLKRLLGDVFPVVFNTELSEKEEEAVANPTRFKGMGQSAKKLAQEDYKNKMEASFREMHRILQENGVLTVMFTHRTAEAWSSLATSLMNANFTFTSSWPVHTEPPDKYAKRGKGVLKVTVLLTCRKRNANHPGIWEHIVEELREVAKEKVEEFSKLGIKEPDLKVSVYGPVLGKFADYFPVKTATGRQIEPVEALDLVTDVLNEKFLQEAGIENTDKETAAYINMIATFPKAETEYEEARLATVFGGLVTLDSLDVKGTYGLVEKKGKNIKLLSSKDRQAKGILDPYKPKNLKTMIDNIHAAIILYERGGLVSLKPFLRERNLDIAGSSFLTVLQAYARYAGATYNENFRKDASMAKALLAALGHSIEFAPRKEERMDHYL